MGTKTVLETLEAADEALLFVDGCCEREVSVERVAEMVGNGEWYFCEANHNLWGSYGDRKLFVYHRNHKKWGAL